MNPILQAIVERTRSDVGTRKKGKLPPPPADKPGFGAVLKGGREGHPRLIAEVKPKSPSEGELRPRAEFGPVLEAYRTRAHAVSVLVDEPYFGGGYDLLQQVRQHLPQPILAKGFFLEPWQVEEAKAHGASAVLLIARLLEGPLLSRMVRCVADHDLEALVEIHRPSELSQALDAGAQIVGVNSRDLDTLEINLPQARALLQEIPQTCLRVAESGLSKLEDIAQVRGIADATLIGTAFVKSQGPASAMVALGW